MLTVVLGVVLELELADELVVGDLVPLQVRDGRQRLPPLLQARLRLAALLHALHLDRRVLQLEVVLRVLGLHY